LKYYNPLFNLHPIMDFVTIYHKDKKIWSAPIGGQ